MRLANDIHREILGVVNGYTVMWCKSTIQIPSQQPLNDSVFSNSFDDARRYILTFIQQKKFPFVWAKGLLD